MCDIYFEKNYGRLYEAAEKGTSVSWQYRGIEGEVTHQFILREIPIHTENGPWFDLVTPYGYGGPVIQSVEPGYSREAVVEGFGRAFSLYCQNNRIVSEFVRFHPIVRNAEDFGLLYNAKHIRTTLGTDLKSYEDPVEAEFTRRCRKKIRKAFNQGVTWRVTQAPDNLDEFQNIYYSTMDRNDAGEFYYFRKEYFENCLRWFRDRLLLVEARFQEKTISAAVCFLGDTTIHIHLSGTLTEYLHLSPAYILRYAIVVWGKERNYHLIHHGGGKSNAPDDSLYTFKAQFAQNTSFPFFVGKKIWNQDAYELLCSAAKANLDSEYFPLYRAP